MKTKILMLVVDHIDHVEDEIGKAIDKLGLNLKFNIQNEGSEDGNFVYVVNFLGPKEEIMKFGKKFKYYPFGEDDIL